MTHGSLFSGIGGFDLAAEWVGWTNVFHCEINPFGQNILKYYWPNAISYDDITKTDFTIHRGRIDVLTGGFPCQPFSVAGKRKGTADHRNLWPEYFRAICEIQPLWVVGENVPGIINWSDGLVFEQVQADLESEGYEVWPVVLPACSVNAPHKRERGWFVAYSCNVRQQGGDKGMSATPKFRHDEKDMFTAELQRSEWADGLPRPRIFRDDDGLSERLDGISIFKWRDESIKAYGNAIVPQVAYQIFRAINEFVI